MNGYEQETAQKEEDEPDPAPHEELQPEDDGHRQHEDDDVGEDGHAAEIHADHARPRLAVVDELFG